jgi:serine/threonine protein kinase
MTDVETVQELETQLNEIRILSSLHHKNIVTYYNSWVEVMMKRKPARKKETSERILINNIVYW